LSQFVSRSKAIRLTGASADYKLLPSPKMTDEEAKNIRETFDKLTQGIRLTSSKKKLRSILLPGENYWDFKDEMRGCRTESARRECILNRMAKNWWTLDDEKHYAKNARSIGYDLYNQRSKYKGIILVEAEPS